MDRYYFPLPYIYQIETTERCNLQCPTCLNPMMEGKGDISFELVEHIVEKGYLQNTLYTELQMAGEPLLYKRLHDVIETIRGTDTMVGLSTSLSVMNKAAMETINALDCVTISFDVFDEAAYEKSRYPMRFLSISSLTSIYRCVVPRCLCLASVMITFGLTALWASLVINDRRPLWLDAPSIPALR